MYFSEVSGQLSKRYRAKIVKKHPERGRANATFERLDSSKNIITASK